MSSNFPGRRYKTLPLVQFEERHGGPLWYDLAQIILQFEEDNTGKIIIDRSFSKTNAPIKAPITILDFQYTEYPHGVNYQQKRGALGLSTGEKIYFETLIDRPEYLYLERPSFWKESLVLSNE